MCVIERGSALVYIVVNYVDVDSSRRVKVDACVKPSTAIVTRYIMRPPHHLVPLYTNPLLCMHHTWHLLTLHLPLTPLHDRMAIVVMTIHAGVYETRFVAILSRHTSMIRRRLMERGSDWLRAARRGGHCILLLIVSCYRSSPQVACTWVCIYFIATYHSEEYSQISLFFCKGRRGSSFCCAKEKGKPTLVPQIIYKEIVNIF